MKVKGSINNCKIRYINRMVPHKLGYKITPGMGDTLREGWLFLSGLDGLQKENNSSGF